jgi:hypothetical protein
MEQSKFGSQFWYDLLMEETLSLGRGSGGPCQAGPPGPMNILGLNCRRLGLDMAVGELRDLVRSYNPVVVFLSETNKKS